MSDKFSDDEYVEHVMRRRRNQRNLLIGIVLIALAALVFVLVYPLASN